MKNRNNPSRRIDLLFYISAFLIPVAGLLCILFSRHFYPFGENTLFTMDMRTQYAEFYASLRYLFQGDNSLFCSWSRSWGGNYIGLFAYYLASPLSWIVNLFPMEKLYVGILLLTLLKIGLCGLTFSVLALALWKRSYHTSSLRQFLLLPLAVSYALMSYNIVYSQALMWLDGVLFLPLVILGVEKLTEQKKGLLLILSLTGCFFCNYYTGYMVALFTALYAVFRLSVSARSLGRKACLIFVRRFLACALLSGGLASPLLLPVLLDLFMGKLTGVAVTSKGATSFAILDFLKKYANGSYDSLTYSNLPNIYCGYLVLAMVLVFFAVRTVPLYEKLGGAAMLLLLFLGMYVTKLNVLWHGFKAPNSYPFRDSFLFSFFLLYLALRALLALPLDKLPDFQRRRPILETVFLAAMLFVAVDLGLNGRALLFHIEDEYDYDTVTDYENYLVTTAPLLSEIKASDDGFYRINQLYEYSKNDAMLWGYNGLTHYSSTYNQAVNHLTGDLGMAADWLWNAGYGATPLTDSLLSVRYVLARYDLPPQYELLSLSGYGTSSYYNRDALPIAYSAPVSELNPEFGGDSFANQNLLLQSITGEATGCFSPVPFTCSETEQGWSYTFTAPSYDSIYLNMPSEEYTYTEVYVNERFVGNYFSSETRCNLYLGEFEPGETVTVSVCPDARIHVEQPVIYSLSAEKLHDALDMLNANGMQINYHKNGRLSGTIHVPEGQMILTSIPYDAGWTIKIDNQKVPAECFADTFLAVGADSGDHTISFTYVSPGFLPGVILFCFALAFCILYLRRGRSTGNGNPDTPSVV